MTKILLSANTDWYLYNFRFSLARHLRREGFEVVLVSPPGRFAPAFAEQNFRWRSWGLGRKTLAPWVEIHSLLSLVQIYRQEQPDLLHHHTIKPVLYGSLIAQRLGYQNVVNSITGRGYVFIGKGWKARLLKRLVQPFYRLAFRPINFAAIFENEVDRQYFINQNFISEGRTWLIPGVGVDPEQFVPAPEPPGPPVILFSGRMLWDKGVGVLVDAVKLLPAGLSYRIVLVGEPDSGNPSSINQQQLHKWHEDGLVEWWGWRSDMNDVYAQSAIVVLPTMYGEGVPTVLLEAAACGRPIIATDIPGCREITIHEQNGLLVPADDPVRLAQALETLIADPDLRGRMGKVGRQLVLQKFTASQVNEQTLAVYQRVLTASPGLKNPTSNPPGISQP